MEAITAATGVAGVLHIASQVKSSLKNAHDAAKTGASYFKNGSLIDIAQVARVEPIMIVDADVMHVDFMPDLAQSMHAIFSGYYLQAVNLLGNIGGVSVASKLAPLNPSRTLGFEDRKDWRFASEAYKHRLPTTHNKQAMAMEAASVNASLATDDKDISNLKDAANLSVGKMFNIKISENGESANIPVAIRLMVTTLSTNTLVNLFTFKDNFDMELKERFHAWKAGRLGFIKDLILCGDLIDKHRKTLIKDNTDIYSQILGRETANIGAGLINKNPSLATASNLAIISTDTLDQIEQKISGKFSNFKVRQQIFDTTNLMILAVVDKQWGRVTFYHRGIQETTQVSDKDMRNSNKGGGSDVLDIMKAYMAGSAPSI